MIDFNEEFATDRFYELTFGRRIGLTLLVLVGGLATLQSGRFLRSSFESVGMTEFEARLSAGSCVRILLIYLTIACMRRFRLLDFSGLKTISSVENAQAFLIPLTIIIVGISSNLGTYSTAALPTLLLFSASVLVVGIFEELFFRGVLLPLLIKTFWRSKWSVMIGVVISSSIFGLSHYFNLISQPGNVIGITSQVIFATAMGVFFCGLFLRTNSILLVALIHGLINFAFGAGQLKPAPTVDSDGVMVWSDLLSSLPAFALIFISGLVMLRFANLEARKQALKFPVAG